MQEEEEERSDKWKDFLERCAGAGPAETPLELSLEEDTAVKLPKSAPDEIDIKSLAELSNRKKEDFDEDRNGVCDASKGISSDESQKETTESSEIATSRDKAELWAEIRPSLGAIEHMMSFRVKKKKTSSGEEYNMGRIASGKHLTSIEEGPSQNEESDDEFYDVERSDAIQELPSNEGVHDDLAVDTASLAVDRASQEYLFPWKEELECLVRGGVPMALRGEVKSVCVIEPVC